jgi:hypothetical protein
MIMPKKMEGSDVAFARVVIFGSISKKICWLLSDFERLQYGIHGIIPGYLFKVLKSGTNIQNYQ